VSHRCAIYFVISLLDIDIHVGIFARLRGTVVRVLDLEPKPISSIEDITSKVATIDKAANAILGRKAHRASLVKDTVANLLSDCRAREKAATRFYHDRKRIATFVGIILTILIKHIAFCVDPKVLMGGSPKIVLCAVGEFLNARCAISLVYADIGKPRAKKILTCLAILPPILGCIAGAVSDLPDDFTIDPSAILQYRGFKVVKAVSEGLKALLTFSLLFWANIDGEGLQCTRCTPTEISLSRRSATGHITTVI
jgi:hypothetical protein